MIDPVSAYFDAVNAEDWDALAGLWAPDAELYPAGARPRQGREAIGAFYPRLLAAWAEHTDRPVRRITEADTVVVEISFTGTTHEGRSVAFDAVDVFDLAGPLIRRLSIWYDTAAVLRQAQGA
ncbi:MAG: nuclear transport factor 2 family protein [Streptosporangiaceae bacterium]|jgi:ketosteroid isomerase-like protein